MIWGSVQLCVCVLNGLSYAVLCKYETKFNDFFYIKYPDLVYVYQFDGTVAQPTV